MKRKLLTLLLAGLLAFSVVPTIVFAEGEDALTITFDANGGSGTMAPHSFTRGEETTIPACTFTAPEGGKFLYWIIGDEAIMANAPFIGYANATAIAFWEIESRKDEVVKDTASFDFTSDKKVTFQAAYQQRSAFGKTVSGKTFPANEGTILLDVLGVDPKLNGSVIKGALTFVGDGNGNFTVSAPSDVTETKQENAALETQEFLLDSVTELHRLDNYQSSVNSYLVYSASVTYVYGPVAKAPTITKDPVDVTITNGHDASFTVEASGVNLTYEWHCVKENGDFKLDETTPGFKGFDTATLSIPSTFEMNKPDCARDGYEFYCIVKNDIGSAKSKSAVYHCAHEGKGEWKSNEKDHWLVCDCGEKTNIAPHEYDGKKCKVCGHEMQSCKVTVYLVKNGGTPEVVSEKDIPINETYVVSTAAPAGFVLDKVLYNNIDFTYAVSNNKIYLTSFRAGSVNELKVCVKSSGQNPNPPETTPPETTPIETKAPETHIAETIPTETSTPETGVPGESAFTEGDGITWHKDSGAVQKFTLKNNEKIKTIKVDGQTPPDGGYVIAMDTPSCMLLSNTLQTLGIGQHTITVETEKGTYTAKFTVAEPLPETAPETKTETEPVKETEKETTPETQPSKNQKKVSGSKTAILVVLIVVIVAATAGIIFCIVKRPF